jgi:lysylphosphatidylglycerol synthetase-like protein (DUF2156 family)
MHILGGKKEEQDGKEWRKLRETLNSIKRANIWVIWVQRDSNNLLNLEKDTNIQYKR